MYPEEGMFYLLFFIKPTGVGESRVVKKVIRRMRALS